MITLYVKQTRIGKQVAHYAFEFFNGEGEKYISFGARSYSDAIDYAKYLIDKVSYSEMYEFVKMK